jgi:hypothetical protein
MGTGTFRDLKPLSRALGIVVVSIVPLTGTASAGDGVGQQMPVFDRPARQSMEIVDFGDGRHTPVRVLRGTDPTGSTRVRREITTFGAGSQHVAVFRGTTEPAPIPDAPPKEPAATFLSGSYLADLIKPGGDEQYLRIADAVHWAESGYGTNSRMWRPDHLSGPQGPMQVSAAAALDVGGGNRFDIYENMQLGRFYLARMFRRYGNWSDALAAYNWGPGNVDQWIARGRNAQELPAETTRYVEYVLRRALFGSGMAQPRSSQH